jgi:hypothetical protein
LFGKNKTANPLLRPSALSKGAPMRVQRPAPVVVALLLLPTVAHAHDHTADFFGGISFANASTLWGLHQSLAITSPSPANHDLSFIGDFTVHFGSHDDRDLTRVTFLGGIRYAPTGMRYFKNVVSFHLLAGGVHDGAAEGSTEPALALGAGYEFLPKGDKSASGWAIRLQGDYVIVNDRESFPRFSAGVVYRIKH